VPPRFEVESNIYTCRAVGSPSPRQITWSARERGSNDVVQLTNSIDGVEISDNERENSGLVGTLRLTSSGSFSSPFCAVTNDASNGVLRNGEFTPIEPIEGIVLKLQRHT
jgi:hypothetical protein